MSGPWEKYSTSDQASAATPAPAADGPWSKYATPSAAAPVKSDAQSLGESQPGIIKAAISTLQGPAMGFADELAGVGGAITGAVANLTPYGDGKSFTQNYRDTRDAARAASDSHMRENPVLGHVERIAASLPVIAATPAIQAAQKGGSFLSAVPESIKAGVKFGAIAGAGDSTATDVTGIAKDSAASAAIGGALGPIVSGIVRGGSAVASNIAQQIASSPTGRTTLNTIQVRRGEINQGLEAR